MLMGIKLLNRVGNDSDFVRINIYRVNYVDLYQPTEHSAKVPVFHTPEGSYLAVMTLVDIETAYKPYGFVKHGRSVVVNEGRIKDKFPVKGGTEVVFTDGSKLFVRKKL